MVSPYAWDVPGGVQAHIKDLAHHFLAEGHEISVLAPALDESSINEEFVVSAGSRLQSHITEQLRACSSGRSLRREFANGSPEMNLMSCIYMSRQFHLSHF